MIILGVQFVQSDSQLRKLFTRKNAYKYTEDVIQQASTTASTTITDAVEKINTKSEEIKVYIKD